MYLRPSEPDAIGFGFADNGALVTPPMQNTIYLNESLGIQTLEARSQRLEADAGRATRHGTARAAAYNSGV